MLIKKKFSTFEEVLVKYVPDKAVDEVCRLLRAQ